MTKNSREFSKFLLCMCVDTIFNIVHSNKTGTVNNNLESFVSLCFGFRKAACLKIQKVKDLSFHLKKM